MSKLRLNQLGTLDNSITLNVKDINNASAISLSEYSELSLGDWLGQRRSLRDFGAKGDGITDDTVSVQSALTWAANQPSGALLNIDAGTYILSSSLSFNGGSAQVFLKGPNSGAAYLSWTSDSATQGIKGGLTTPISRFGIEGVTFITKAVSSAPAMNLVFNKASPKSLIMRDVSGYGPAVGGDPANGYWGDGLVVAKDPVYPIFEHCYFFGIGGDSSVSKSNLINSAYRVTSSGGVFFCNFRNCFANNINNAIWLITLSNPGIEGTFIESCNFNSCNVGVAYEGQNSGSSGYYPPQLFINNSQFEFLQRGVSVQHASKVEIRGNLFYSDPTTNDAITHILLTDCNVAIVSENMMETRSVDVQADGVVCSGSSSYVDVKDNYIDVTTGHYGVVFAGSSSNCRQSGNRVKNGNEYANTSSNSSTNTAESYINGGERSISMPGGLVMKSGSRTVTLGAGGTFSLNWISGFPNTITTCTLTSGDSAASATSPAITTLSGTGVTGVFSGVASGVSVRVNYIALGT